MRKIVTSDIFTMVRIIRKIGLDDIKSYVGAFSGMKIDNVKNVREKGAEILIDIICSALEKLPEIEADLCGFVAGICEKETKEIEALPPAEFVDIIYEIAHKEEFTDFFTAVSRFFVSETKKKKAK